MATYGQFYYKLLEKVSNDYQGLHNLAVLDQQEEKIDCYKHFSQKPHQYYECFRKIENRHEADTLSLAREYSTIEEDYKLCSESCKQTNGGENKDCINKCISDFSGSIMKMYDSYYKTKVGSRKEYKKVKN